MSLPGIASSSPIPRVARFFKPAAGSSVSAGNIRPVVLVGNMLSGGTETVETLGGPIQSLSDCFTRFARRSEISKMYQAYIAVDPDTIISAVAVAEGGGASASTCSFQFNGAASKVTSIDIWSCDGETQVGVAVGDSVTTLATNVTNAINADPDLPFSAAVDTTNTTIASGSNSQALPQGTINVVSTTGFPTSGTILIGTLNTLVQYTGVTSTTFTGCTGGVGTMLTGYTVTNAGQVNITTYHKGPRSAGWINQLRMLNDDPSNATVIVRSSVTAGSVNDSNANAIIAIDSKEFTYHCIAATATSSVSSSDNGVGSYFAYIAKIIAPTGNKSSMAIFAVDGTSAQATAVTQSAAVNQVFGHCYRVHGNDWHPAMVAAHHTAVHRFAEVNYCAANLAGWTNNSTLGQVYQIPPPYVSTNAPTQTEMTTDLNGGVSTVGFRTNGTPYIVRSITTYSWTGSSSTADYRAREGHLPSVLIQFWDDFKSRLQAQNQPNIASDPPQGGKPVAGFIYPRSVISMANTLITAMTKGYQDNKAILDPSVLKTMLAATDCQVMADGFEAIVNIAAVRHNLQDDTTIAEIGPAY